MLLASLSPEVKSGRMYTGPGAESMLVAAGSWDMTGGPSRLESRSLRMLPEMVG
ncbi:PPE domain-containing protein [Mycobacterium persicum]|nr:PPE domain-containing protein [Mycobacterium persicum]VAZ78671.1 putative PPE family protein PPE51 [Mycobacterium persicum]VAZ85327.1 putative PPE family protein PPE51 [Mycobacterium persicum]VAZ98073.1 putative PPE family protein PPE51 [Mycobacterium persicum]